MAYKAFLSYSHKADAPLAEAFQASLHRFATPWYRFPTIQVFRDKTSLSANPALWPAIEKALSESEYFLLMASPPSAASTWVNQEIDWWLKNRLSERMLILLTEGEIEWLENDFDWDRTTALPKALSGKFEHLPLYVDLRWAREEESLSLRHLRFRSAVLDIAAPLHGKPKETLDSQDVRQHRRARRLMRSGVAALIGLLFIMTFLALYAFDKSLDAQLGEIIAEDQRHKAEAQRKRAEAEQKRAEEKERDANEQRKVAEQKRLEAEHRTAQLRANTVLLNAEVAPDPLVQVLLARELRGAPEPLESVRKARVIAEKAVPLAVLRGHEGPPRGRVSSVSFSPDGSRVVTTSRDNTARIWRTDGTGGAIVLRGHLAPPTNAEFSPDGSRIVTASGDGTLRVWRVDGKGEVIVFGKQGDNPCRWTRDAKFSPDGRQVLALCGDDTVRRWDFSSPSLEERVILRGEGFTRLTFCRTGVRFLVHSSSGQVLVSSIAGDSKPVVLSVPGESITHADLSSEGLRVITASTDRKARIWTLNQPIEPIVLPAQTEEVTAVGFSPDGARVLVALGEKPKAKSVVRIFKLDGTGEPVDLRGPTDRIVTATFSPDGLQVLTASSDGVARLYRSDSGEISRVLYAGEEQLAGAIFSPDGSRAASIAAAEGVIRTWNIDLEEPKVLRFGDRLPVIAAAFSPEGSRVALLLQNGATYVKRIDGKEKPLLVAPGDPLFHALPYVEFSPDGSWIATSSSGSSGKVTRIWKADGSGTTIDFDRPGHVFKMSFSPDSSRVVATMEKDVYIWKVHGKGKPVVLRGHQGVVWNASFSHDGSRVLTHGDDYTARLWRADGSGSPVILGSPNDQIFKAELNRDGSRVLIVSREGGARVWRSDGTGDPLILGGKLRDGSRERVGDAVFSPDGLRIAAASEEGVLRIWRLDRNEDPTILDRHTGSANVASFSPDGSLVISVSNDGTARLWRTDGTGEPIELRGHRSLVTQVDFSPDGSRVVTTSHDGTARIWRVSWPSLLDYLGQLTTICLTPRQRIQYLEAPRTVALSSYHSCERSYGRVPSFDLNESEAEGYVVQARRFRQTSSESADLRDEF